MKHRYNVDLMTKAELAALNRAIKEAGGLTATARALGVSPTAVQNWRARGLPRKWVVKLSELSKVPREHLAPEMYG